MDSLFDAAPSSNIGVPLAQRMRPKTLEQFEGQTHIVGSGKSLRVMIESGTIPSLILWGPPGVGKTTLAHIIASSTKSRFIAMSAVNGTVAEIRQIIKDADEQKKFYHKQTILFLDEIHRFSKSQQDTLLPAVETGILTLIGATTENPSFEVNSALLSRTRVIVLERLDDESLKKLILRAVADDERGLGEKNISIDDDALALLVRIADGDARSALTALESLSLITVHITVQQVQQGLQKNIFYDKNGEQHYNIISALHKSMRGNDANAALYWLGRMLEAGEDPLYVVRRLIRFASEDIGLADPHALVQATSAFTAVHMMGLPECNVVLAQCVAYLARAPKSNALYTAYQAVQSDIRNLPNVPVPLHLRNAPTKLMKELDYGKNYKYTPAFENPADAKQDFLPEALKKRKYLST